MVSTGLSSPNILCLWFYSMKYGLSPLTYTHNWSWKSSIGIDLRSISILFLITKINIFLIEIFVKIYLCYSQWTVLIILINAHYIPGMITASFFLISYIYHCIYIILYLIVFYTHTHMQTHQLELNETKNLVSFLVHNNIICIILHTHDACYIYLHIYTYVYNHISALWGRCYNSCRTSDLFFQILIYTDLIVYTFWQVENYYFNIHILQVTSLGGD